jgi:hypothetical protein
MVVIEYLSGMRNRYEVVGMPGGQTAEIRLTVLGSVEHWRICRNSGRFRGAYNNAEDALSALQSQVEVEGRALHSGTSHDSVRSMVDSHS